MQEIEFVIIFFVSENTFEMKQIVERLEKENINCIVEENTFDKVNLLSEKPNSLGIILVSDNYLKSMVEIQALGKLLNESLFYKLVPILIDGLNPDVENKDPNSRYPTQIETLEAQQNYSYFWDEEYERLKKSAELDSLVELEKKKHQHNIEVALNLSEGEIVNYLIKITNLIEVKWEDLLEENFRWLIDKLNHLKIPKQQIFLEEENSLEKEKISEQKVEIYPTNEDSQEEKLNVDINELETDENSSPDKLLIEKSGERISVELEINEALSIEKNDRELVEFEAKNHISEEEDDINSIQIFLENLLNREGLKINTNNKTIFEKYVQEPRTIALVKDILLNQEKLMKNLKLNLRIKDILGHFVTVANGTVGSKYSAKINFGDLDLSDLIEEKIEGLEDIGLSYNKIDEVIEGIPNQSGNLAFHFYFKLDGESQKEELHKKTIQIIINPNPKSLWKNLPSDKYAMYWKEENRTQFEKLGSKHLLVSSKRGRSHANVGSFRDDDYAFGHVEQTGWSIAAVSDGAGSYAFSRKGSEIACNSVVDYFREHSMETLENKIQQYAVSKGDDAARKEMEHEAMDSLYQASVFAHNQIKKFGEQASKEHAELFNSPKAKSYLDYFHATLIFTLFKEYEFGTLVLSFGVGDCPIAILNKEKTEISLLNHLDVGEFGGGTRFITQPEIFQNKEKILTRFNVKIIEDFSYLFLMTDGIYDPKFVVEANLEKTEKWIDFLADLNGENESKTKVDLTIDNENIKEQLSEWMDFWCVGEHDDRTLAIIF